MVKSKLFDLTGKVGIVTGSGRGLGKTIAIGLSEYGAKVANLLTQRRGSGSDGKADQGAGRRGFAIRVDTSLRADCQILIDETIRR